MDKYKPAVPKVFLLLLAGVAWEGVGFMLLTLAFSWLAAVSGMELYLLAGLGLFLGMLVHHFGFLKIVDKNLKRILQMSGKKCLFSFFPRKSYLLVVVMISMGYGLRHSMIPKKYLAVLYAGIGLALLLSSVRYLRIFFKEIKNLKKIR